MKKVNPNLPLLRYPSIHAPSLREGRRKRKRAAATEVKGRGADEGSPPPEKERRGRRRRRRGRRTLAVSKTFPLGRYCKGKGISSGSKKNTKKRQLLPDSRNGRRRRRRKKSAGGRRRIKRRMDRGRRETRSPTRLFLSSFLSDFRFLSPPEPRSDLYDMVVRLVSLHSFFYRSISISLSNLPSSISFLPEEEGEVFFFFPFLFRPVPFSHRLFLFFRGGGGGEGGGGGGGEGFPPPQVGNLFAEGARRGGREAPSDTARRSPFLTLSRGGREGNNTGRRRSGRMG